MKFLIECSIQRCKLLTHMNFEMDYSCMRHQFLWFRATIFIIQYLQVRAAETYVYLKS